MARDSKKKNKKDKEEEDSARYQFFDRVWSKRKRHELLNILIDPNPSHERRLYLVGFLRHVGYEFREILEIIDWYNDWQDYDKAITAYHVYSIFNKQRKNLLSLKNKQTNLHPSLSKKNFSKKSVILVKKYARFDDNSVLKDWNALFFDLACAVAYEYKPGKFNRSGNIVWDPIRYPLYRTCAGEDHCLFVIDIDANNLEYAWKVTREIWNIEDGDFDFLKFSGSRGFHLIKRLDGRWSRSDLEERGKRIFKELDKDAIGLIDRRLLNPLWLIRGYSVNYKSGLYSVPVLMYDDVTKILERAKLQDTTLLSSGGGVMQ